MMHTPLSNKPHRDAFGSLSQEQWFRVLKRSQSQSLLAGVSMPLFPPQQLQTDTHGTSGSGAINEAAKYFRLIDRYCESEGLSITAATRVLDFGCGWGRMLRFFLNRVDAANLYGVDVREESVALARQLNPFSSFSKVEALPPTDFEDDSFDLVMAYSVFSHLNETASRAWIREMARILKPGGLAILTTQGRSFLDFVESLSTHPRLWALRQRVARLIRRPIPDFWLRMLRDAFQDMASAKRSYEDGRFVHVASGGGGSLDASFYGESVIPRGYIEREWSELELLDFVDDRRLLAQALIVLRKPEI